MTVQGPDEKVKIMKAPVDDQREPAHRWELGNKGEQSTEPVSQKPRRKPALVFALGFVGILLAYVALDRLQSPGSAADKIALEGLGLALVIASCVGIVWALWALVKQRGPLQRATLAAVLLVVLDGLLLSQGIITLLVVLVAVPVQLGLAAWHGLRRRGKRAIAHFGACGSTS